MMEPFFAKVAAKSRSRFSEKSSVVDKWQTLNVSLLLLSFILVSTGFYNGSRDIWDWLWFSYGAVHSERGFISVFQEFFASIGRAFILAGGLGAGLSFYGV